MPACDLPPDRVPERDPDVPPSVGAAGGPKFGPPRLADLRPDFGPDDEWHIEHYWYNIDLEIIEPYEIWKPASLRWAKKEKKGSSGAGGASASLAVGDQ